MKYKYILYEPGKVARIKINRPEYKNALSYEVFEEIDDAFTQAEKDDKVMVVLLSGEGADFSSGHDLGSPESLADTEKRGGGALGPWKDLRTQYLMEKEHKLDQRLHQRNLTKPTIAMVQGWCIFGATQLASACDIIFASEDALFVPLLGQYHYPPWELGPRKAKEVLFEHRAVSAREARDLGWVNRVYPRAKLEKATLAYANRVADNQPDRVRTAKAVINHMMDTQGFTTEVQYAFSPNLISVEGMIGGQWAKKVGLGGQTRRERRLGRPDVALENLKLKEADEVK